MVTCNFCIGRGVALNHSTTWMIFSGCHINEKKTEQDVNMDIFHCIRQWCPGLTIHLLMWNQYRPYHFYYSCAWIQGGRPHSNFGRNKSCHTWLKGCCERLGDTSGIFCQERQPTSSLWVLELFWVGEGKVKQLPSLSHQLARQNVEKPVTSCTRGKRQQP